MESHADPIPRLLDAAVRLVTAGVPWRMADIAREAGTSRATLYRAFSSRQALTAALAAQRGLRVPSGSHERILAAALAVLVRAGIEGATVEAIAGEAGLSPVTLYRHFKDRESLIEAALATAPPRSDAQLLALKGDDPDLDLPAFATSTLAFLAEHGELLRMAIGAPRGRISLLSRLHASHRSTTASLAAYLLRQMEAGRLPRKDPRFLALAFLSTLMTAGFLGPTFGEVGGPPEVIGPSLARLFLDGARGAA